MRNKLILWLLGCFLVTLFCGLVYISCQQIIRQSANYPQLQIASDITIASKISQVELDNILPKQKVDAIQSISPFVIIFDSNFNIRSTNAITEGQQIQKKPPVGVFSHTTSVMPNVFTWEPVPSFRFAAVVQEINLDGKKGYVLVARSLGYAENLENQMLIYAGFAWILGIGVVSFVTFLVSKSSKKK